MAIQMQTRRQRAAGFRELQAEFEAAGKTVLAAKAAKRAAEFETMRTMDNSTVYHVSILDVDIQAEWHFATEDEACREQRAYRAQIGHDPISGERLD